MGQIRTSRRFDIVFIAVLGAGLWWATAHRTAIGDGVFFLHYRPSARVEAVARAASLSQTGRRLLYRSDPQFLDAAGIAAACDTERLGCLDSQGRAYVLDDPTKPEQTTVTAAHEMLHLAYRRLSANSRAELAGPLDQAVQANSASGITDELSDQTSSEDRLDEAHSLLGTEYAELPAALESYYHTYFDDRTKIVAAEQGSRR